MGISKVYYIESKSHDPYYNLALEEKLLEVCNENDLIFYLWQNDNTVVIGKNQSAFKECNINAMNKDNVKLARRLSGGGAVYHDLGNLNFTFIMHRQNYDLNRQLTVIKEALNKHGAYAYFSGRNDILIGDKKISGNAFYLTNDISYHHGTILLNSNLNNLSKYLKVSKSKLEANGVDSIRSRVENISKFVKDLDIETLKKDLKESVVEVFWLPIENLEINEVNLEKYSDPKWLYRKEVESNYEIINKFPWGEINIKFIIENNTITKVSVFSDSMDIGISDKLEKILLNKKFDYSIIDEIKELDDPNKNDLISLFTEILSD